MIEHFTVSTKQHVRNWRRYSTANKSQFSNHHPEWGQILCREIIDRAIDDSLRVPEKQSNLESENCNVRRGANERSSVKQSGIGFVTSEDFLGLYSYAYGSTGEFLQRELGEAHVVISRDPTRSNYYRKIFNQLSGERGDVQS